MKIVWDSKAEINVMESRKDDTAIRRQCPKIGVQKKKKEKKLRKQVEWKHQKNSAEKVSKLMWVARWKEPTHYKARLVTFYVSMYLCIYVSIIVSIHLICLKLVLLMRRHTV